MPAPAASVPRDATIALAAVELRRSEIKAVPVGAVSGEPWFVQPGEAYRVQLAQAATRTEAGGIRRGFKVGLTSSGMQNLLGVTEPDFGHLFADMEVENGGTLNPREFILPKAEPELAFVLRAPLGADRVLPEDVIAATDYVTVAIEVVDSRIRDWKITWTDTVADNGSSSRFVLGDARMYLADAAGTLRSLRTDLVKNDELVGTAPLSEVMGDPITSVCWLAETLYRFGIEMQPGDVILSGSPCAATNLLPGDHVVANIENIGSVTVTVDEERKGTP
ncbi:2-keto-4-pentenoate hydratase [Arthrobacter sp. AZCC_0090]|uniref:2-keto-4-pentenoate hydratase n=1 Tax=Arthrobacter sp. AZCC_0090 TaxID=2735881 RepID=UPI00161144D4|nr:fumarylacetoacetate hydrolase family protein [Arthrobacter sp. AZCC_0090]MBB6406335.1 2-keto-4-pentenoate hydratase [Arthrobacter sp. AZCC_0090]